MSVSFGFQKRLPTLCRWPIHLQEIAFAVPLHELVNFSLLIESQSIAVVLPG
jgi:hypothetical protein